jgi:sec-independent protein translocase protein TatC
MAIGEPIDRQIDPYLPIRWSIFYDSARAGPRVSDEKVWASTGERPAFGTRKYTVLLFLGGVALACFLVLPQGLGFLLNFSSGYFNVQNRASDYFTFMALFILAFGVVFELPVVLVLLARVGVVDDKFLRKNRRYAIVILAVASAVITPSQDAFSMLAMFVPLYILYEASIVIARFVQPKQAAEEGASPAEDTQDEGLS